jgi:hypothetical protein
MHEVQPMHDKAEPHTFSPALLARGRGNVEARFDRALDRDESDCSITAQSLEPRFVV